MSHSASTSSIDAAGAAGADSAVPMPPRSDQEKRVMMDVKRKESDLAKMNNMTQRVSEAVCSMCVHMYICVCLSVYARVYEI